MPNSGRIFLISNITGVSTFFFFSLSSLRYDFAFAAHFLFNDRSASRSFLFFTSSAIISSNCCCCDLMSATTRGPNLFYEALVKYESYSTGGILAVVQYPLSNISTSVLLLLIKHLLQCKCSCSLIPQVILPQLSHQQNCKSYQVQC